MNKKWICSMAAAAILMGLLPTAALAADTPYRITNWVMDFRDGRNDCDGDGWDWDARSKTLTLEDFNVLVPDGEMEEQAAIFLPKESTIYLNGKNNELTTESYHCAGIYCEGELYISGSGKLKITTESYGASAIYVDHGPLVFDDKAEVTIEPAGYVIYIDEAKGRDGVINVLDRAKVIFPDDSTDRNITVTHKSSVKPTKDWFNYEEEIDRDDETVTLVAKKEKPADTDKEDKDNKTDEQEKPTEPVKHSYQVTIGSPAIVKDGKVSYTADAAPYLKNGYTMLPLRALLNVSDDTIDIAWDAATKTVSVLKCDENTSTDKDQNDTAWCKKATIPIGEKIMVCGADSYTLSTPAETKNGRTFVSLRDWMQIMDALDMPKSELSWDSKTKTVTFSY